MGVMDEVPPFQPGQGTVPTGGGGGNTVIEQLMRVLSGQPGQGQTGMGTINQPRIPVAPLQQKSRPQPEFGGQNEFRTKGGRNRAALNNIFGNVSKMISSAQQNKDQKEMRNLSMDIERLLLAAENPEDPHNKEVIESILSDDKKRKKIGEALNIQFGPQEDKRDPKLKAAADKAIAKISQPSPAAGGQAQQQQGGQPQPQQQQAAPTGTPRADAFLKQMPTQLAQDPRMAQMLAMMKGAAPYAAAESRERAATTYADSRRDVAQVGAESKAAASKAMLLGKQIDALSRMETRLAGENARHSNRISEIREQHKLAMIEKEPDKRMKILTEASNATDKMVTQAENEVKDREKEVNDLMKVIKGKDNDDVKKDAMGKLQAASAGLQYARAMKSSASTSKQLILTDILNEARGGGNGSTNGRNGGNGGNSNVGAGQPTGRPQSSLRLPAAPSPQQLAGGIAAQVGLDEDDDDEFFDEEEP